MTAALSELLFSYGTLQQEGVQRATFGRLLQGVPDALPGWRVAPLPIRDAQVVATSGKGHHPIARPASAEDRVEGMVFAVTPQELAHADRYEVSEYRRVLLPLASGRRAWVYVDAGADAA
ncbi:gamma-glutamylcyclotransferase family protein [Paracidovorax anthurii]|uniref:Gamma-glutamyl AIG2-like cyclotransferase n=1 Tax=Paracidovorax anthurii TaxID=78229 RepID=A0A328ZP71_9BURK|nr:gamma-glutamylcyclotransferase family protein [Paracidovorax anthurii]RAR86542.1 gamma-glutamyl AIG2-like cyclotransferase [Paracidovorax anthurii]